LWVEPLFSQGTSDYVTAFLSSHSCFLQKIKKVQTGCGRRQRLSPFPPPRFPPSRRYRSPPPPIKVSPPARLPYNYSLPIVLQLRISPPSSNLFLTPQLFLSHEAPAYRHNGSHHFFQAGRERPLSDLFPLRYFPRPLQTLPPNVR